MKFQLMDHNVILNGFFLQFTSMGKSQGAYKGSAGPVWTLVFYWRSAWQATEASVSVAVLPFFLF